MRPHYYARTPLHCTNSNTWLDGGTHHRSQHIPLLSATPPPSAPLFPDSKVTRPKRRKRKPRKATGKSTAIVLKPPRVLPPVEYILVPKKFFTDPLFNKITASVRPPTAHTRRREVELKARLPLGIFTDMIQALDTAEVTGLEWLDAEKTMLKPTNKTASSDEYIYHLTKPKTVDKVIDLRLLRDSVLERRPKAPKYHRGHGASQLFLSKAAAERGQRTRVLSAVTGTVVLQCVVPKDEVLMPTFKMLFGVSTMTQTGHVEWCKEFEAATRKALRGRMRHHLQAMIDSDEYPTLDQMAPAMTQTSDSLQAIFPFELPRLK